MTLRTRELIVATAAGAAASCAMDVVQDGLAALFERQRAPGDHDEETDAIESVVRLIGTFAPSFATEGASRWTARACHYLFGIGFAFAYGAAVRRVRRIAACRGVAFGTGLFLLSDRILIPMLKLGRSWDRYSRSERLNALASHVAYGVVLETVRARFAGERGAGR